MKKDKTRDYATAAFAYWARHGCPTYEEAVQRVRTKAMHRAGGIDQKKAQAYADAEVDKVAAGLCDILACEQTFQLLEESGRQAVCGAVRAVYMVDPWRKPKTNEISGRVLRFAMETPLSERQVWHYLSDARRIFALFRGLRVDEESLD